MKNSIKLIALAAAVLSLMACNKNEVTTVSTTKTALQVVAGFNGTATRAVDQTWNADIIGLMAISATGGTEESTITADYKNACYNTSSTTVTATFYGYDDWIKSAGGLDNWDNNIYFEDPAETVTFAAYGPYEKAYKTDDIGKPAVLPGENADGVISVDTKTQTTTTAQEAIDYIYATGATASETSKFVYFDSEHETAFKHKMAKLVFKIYAIHGLNLPLIEGGTYTFGGLIHTGTFDVTSGTAVADETVDPVSDWTLGDNLPTPDYWLNTSNDENQGVVFTAIILPQTTKEFTFKAEISTQTFETTLSHSSGFEAGKTYTVSIQISENNIFVGGTVEDPDNSDSEGATIDAWEPGDTMSKTFEGSDGDSTD